MNPNLVYLVQTDTTVGFSSNNDERLTTIKQRDKNQKILQTVDSFKSLQNFTKVPKKFRKFVRNSKKTTFIYPNLKSFRVVSKTSHFFEFINKFEALYSTSANLTKQKFDLDFATNNSDVVVYKKDDFFEADSSKIYKLGKIKVKRVR